MGLDQANVYRLIKRLEPVVSKRFKLPHLPKRQISTLEDFKQEYPQVLELIIDATEQQILRPKNKLRKKLYLLRQKEKAHLQDPSDC